MSGSMGRLCLCLLPKNSCAGVVPSCLAMFLQAAIASGKLSPLSWQRMTRDFIDLTAASASPFDSGLYGELSWCVMPLVAQNSPNSVLYAGPPAA